MKNFESLAKQIFWLQLAQIQVELAKNSNPCASPEKQICGNHEFLSDLEMLELLLIAITILQKPILGKFFSWSLLAPRPAAGLHLSAPHPLFNHEHQRTVLG